MREQFAAQSPALEAFRFMVRRGWYRGDQGDTRWVTTGEEIAADFPGFTPEDLVRP